MHETVTKCCRSWKRVPANRNLNVNCGELFLWRLATAYCLYSFSFIAKQKILHFRSFYITSSILFLLQKPKFLFVHKYQKKKKKYKLRLSKHQGSKTSATEYFVEHNSEEHRLQNYKVVLMQEQPKKENIWAFRTIVSCHLFSLALSPLFPFITSSAAQWLCI